MSLHDWATIDIDYHIEIVENYECRGCKAQGGEVYGDPVSGERITLLPVPHFVNARLDKILLSFDCEEAARQLSRFRADEEAQRVARAHVWVSHRIDRGYMASNFWVCDRCKGSGGPVGPGENAPKGAIHLSGTGLLLSHNCEESQRLVEAYDAGVRSVLTRRVQDPLVSPAD